MRVYKDGVSMNAVPDQWKALEAAGWSRTPEKVPSVVKKPTPVAKPVISAAKKEESLESQDRPKRPLKKNKE